MYTIVLIFCYLVAFSLCLLPEIQYHLIDRPSSQCKNCGVFHRQRNKRSEGGGFKAFCSTVCFDLCMQDRWEHGLEGD